MPLSESKGVIATAGGGSIALILAAQYCISGKQNYFFFLTFQKNNHEKLLKFEQLTTTHSHTTERRLWARKKNYGYIEPIHITIPCPTLVI